MMHFRIWNSHVMKRFFLCWGEGRKIKFLAAPTHTLISRLLKMYLREKKRKKIHTTMMQSVLIARIIWVCVTFLTVCTFFSLIFLTRTYPRVSFRDRTTNAVCVENLCYSDRENVVGIFTCKLYLYWWNWTNREV